MKTKHKAERLVLEIHAHGCSAAVEDGEGRCLEFLGDYRNLCAAYRAHGDTCLPVRVRDGVFGGASLYEVQTTGKGQYRMVKEGADVPSPDPDLVRRMLTPCFN